MKCSATTIAGHPCKAWAIKDSDPPLCPHHSGLTGAPKGNSNAVTHGYYRQNVDPEEILSLYDSAGGMDIAQEAVLLRVLLYRLASYLNDPDIPLEKLHTIGPLIVSTTRALGFLHKNLPPQELIDWDEVLDRVGEELDWDL